MKPGYLMGHWAQLGSLQLCWKGSVRCRHYSSHRQGLVCMTPGRPIHCICAGKATFGLHILTIMEQCCPVLEGVALMLCTSYEQHRGAHLCEY